MIDYDNKCIKCNKYDIFTNHDGICIKCNRYGLGYIDIQKNGICKICDTMQCKTDLENMYKLYNKKEISKFNCKTIDIIYPCFKCGKLIYRYGLDVFMGNYYIMEDIKILKLVIKLFIETKNKKDKYEDYGMEYRLRDIIKNYYKTNNTDIYTNQYVIYDIGLPMYDKESVNNEIIKLYGKITYELPKIYNIPFGKWALMPNERNKNESRPEVLIFNSLHDEKDNTFGHAFTSMRNDGNKFQAITQLQALEWLKT